MLLRLHPAAKALTVALLVLAACDIPFDKPRYPELSFNHLPPIRLDVAKVEVMSEYVSPGKPPNVEHLIPTPPSAAGERWGRDRLRAAGTSGTARVVIKRASVVEVPLKRTTGIRGSLTTDQSERYDVEVEMAVMVEKDGRKVTVSSRAKRHRTVPEDITLNQREKVWFALTEAVMKDLNAELETQIRSAMVRYIK